VLLGQHQAARDFIHPSSHMGHGVGTTHWRWFNAMLNGFFYKHFVSNIAMFAFVGIPSIPRKNPPKT